MGLVERFLNRCFLKREIHNCDGDVYLHRWYIIRTLRFALFVHKFVRSDEDRALHDHPWNFIVLPIWRGYWEHSEIRLDAPVPDGSHTWDVKRRVYPSIGIRYRRAEYRHRVELLFKEIEPIYETGKSGKVFKVRRFLNLPAWSLFFRFRKRRAWGFWEKDGFIHNETWWNEKCE